jgi:hypothetical protein
MLTLNITNTSGTDIVAGDGVLPNMLDWISIADAANADAVFQVHDMVRMENNHSGFMFGEMMDHLKQRGLITLNVTDVGDDEDNGSLPDHVVATAA